MAKQMYGNRYQITEKIGVGGMAEVYKAIDTTLGRTVALKVMLPQFAADNTFAARFRQEAQAAANLQSPYIVNIYDWGRDGDSFYIVMEYVRGTDLKSAVQQRGRIHPRKVAEIGEQVCQALSVAHGYGIIHRDIKSANIMVGSDGNVKVMDFGIAQAGNASMTKDSSVLGTAHYVSPEQAQGKQLDPASDLYSLGIVMYEAACGRLPFDGPDVVSVAMKQVNELPIPPREIVGDIDPRLDAIIMKALEKNPEARFRTAAEMKSALDGYLTGRGGVDRTAATTVIGAAAAGATQVIGANGATAATQVIDNGAGGKQEPARKSNRKKIIIALIIALVLAAVGVAVAMTQGASSAKVIVPSVTGMTQDEAAAELEKYELKLGTVSYNASDTVEKGKVVSQDPQANDAVEKDTAVNIVISAGKDESLVQAPNLIGLSAAEAERALTAAGLVGSSSSAESDSYEEGLVFEQNPAALSQVPKGSKVSYKISSGKKQSKVKVANVVGQSQDVAESTLSGQGLSVKVKTGSSDSVGEGEVYQQSIEAGTEVTSGTTVTIYVSTGASSIRVPSVVGATKSDARSTLTSAGFKVSVQNEVDADNVGLVISQDPAGGSAKKGSTVVITVGVSG